MSKFIITAGHNLKGGVGTGAKGIIDEAKEAIVLRNAIVRELQARKLEVITDDDQAELKAVIALCSAKALKSDVLVDIHFNASASKTSNGSEVIIPEKHVDQEYLLAEELLTAICGSLGTRKRNILTESQTPRKTIGMLRYPNCLNVLIEVCFVTSPTDVSLYQANMKKMVVAIANVLEKF